jgi:hypothetical protein
MSEDQLFGLIAMLALLLWLGARMLPAQYQQTAERVAFVLIGGGIAVAVVMTVAHFMG